MIFIWVFISLVMVSLVLFFRKENRDKKLPPGPKGFPIFGCLHLLGDRPHRSLHQLSLKYGPIMHMRLGLVPTIIVSSPQSAELFLKTHDPVFASRPLYEATKHMAYAHKDFAFSQYGSYWRNMRKMTTLELLSNSKINSFRSMRDEELGLLIDYLREAARNRVAVDLSYKVSSINIDMTCLMVFGKKYGDKEFDERGFKAMIQEVLKLFATPNLGNFIPYFAALDLQGLTRRMKSVSKVFDGFLERIIDEHVELKNDSKTRDFVDVMLNLIDFRETEYPIDRSNIKAIVLSLFIAAIDTSATVIEWALAELIKHPNVMKKVQEELEEVVGLDRMVKELELDNLEYLNMVVKEILRLHPPISLIPRETVEDCIVDEFYVPEKSQILINTWAIGRDPSAWIDPDKFFPERFIDSQVNVRGRDFELIPFGSGRRGCPGMQLSIILIRLIVAQLVHCFNWELPNGMLPTELDMREEFGLTSPKAQSLMLFPIYRLLN